MLTRARMGRLLGINRPTLTRIEKVDQNVTLKTLGQLAPAFGCTRASPFTLSD